MRKYWLILALTGFVQFELAVQPLGAASQRVDAVVLVNSVSPKYPDFQHYIQPYLENFGIPYTVIDITTNSLGTNLARYAVMIVGHQQLDTNLVFLTASAQASISAAVSNGTGLVNFDSDLATAGGAPRYQFVQNVFGFTYAAAVSNAVVSFPPTEPSAQMHYITSLHATNEILPLTNSMTVASLTLPTNVTAIALSGTRPFLAVKKHGQGRAVQWASYDWMAVAVMGPVNGLDDLVWRGIVWAARKPFLMRGLPNFVILRVDDVEGPMGWEQSAIEMGFKPFLGLFINLIDETEAAQLRTMVTNGDATTSIHSWDYSSSFFYYDHVNHTNLPDNVISNYFVWGTQWHSNHAIPISKVVVSHYSEFGWNAFGGLLAWGVEFFPIELIPGTPLLPGNLWMRGAPYRLYETPLAGDSFYPLYYADFLTVPNHPEMDGKFFNCYSIIRNAASGVGEPNCGEWCPDNNVPGSIARATRTLKRQFDSLACGTLYTHDRYINPILGSANPGQTVSNYWRLILSGITNNLAPYHPSYVTLDYGCQYVRATRTSRISASDFDLASGDISVSLSGKTDMPTFVYVYTGQDSAISTIAGTVPVFNESVTFTAATLGPPAILAPPMNQTNVVGSSVSFSVDADGTSPLAYHWFRNQVLLTDGGNISGAASDTLTLSGVTSNNAGAYTVAITNALGAATSAPAVLTVVGPPHFAGISLLPDKNVRLSLVGVSNLNYRIEGSTNLADWLALTNVPNPNGSFQVNDRQATNFARRFYRALWVP